MARHSDLHMAPTAEIRIFQETVDDLDNNTLTRDLFELLKKAIVEGYNIRFISYGASDDNETLVQSEDHLRNYINCIQPLKIL